MWRMCYKNYHYSSFYKLVKQLVQLITHSLAAALPVIGNATQRTYYILESNLFMLHIGTYIRFIDCAVFDLDMFLFSL